MITILRSSQLPGPPGLPGPAEVRVAGPKGEDAVDASPCDMMDRGHGNRWTDIDGNIWKHMEVRYMEIYQICKYMETRGS